MRGLSVCALLVSLWTATAAAQPAPAPDTRIYRLFLKSGGTIASFGQWARVPGGVVVSMPLAAATTEHPQIQVVTLPDRAIDWERTDEYATTVRYALYAGTRGESDYKQLMAALASDLNGLGATRAPARRLEIAERARNMVTEWGQTHLGYKAGELREILGLLDEAVSELRVSADVHRFDLNLVASVEAPRAELLGTPTPAEAIEQVLTAARLTDSPAERMAALSRIDDYLKTRPQDLPRDVAKRMRNRARAVLSDEQDVERSYAKLSRSALFTASSAASRGDVRGVEAVLAEIERRDARLGRRRAEHVAAVVSVVQEQLQSARRVRLARDAWDMRIGTYRAYRSGVASILDLFAHSRAALEDIRALAGPEPQRLVKLDQRFARADRQLAAIVAPPDVEGVHAVLRSAVQLAIQAVGTRQAAVRQASVDGAWNASSAAAGCLLLVEQATTDLETLLKPPEQR